MGGWRVVACYEFHSFSRSKYAGDLPLFLKIFSKIRDDALTLSIRCVMSLKKTRSFLIERGHSSTVCYK
jgi:hypothetical protein